VHRHPGRRRDQFGCAPVTACSVCTRRLDLARHQGLARVGVLSGLREQPREHDRAVRIELLRNELRDGASERLHCRFELAPWTHDSSDTSR
jgi:hypothetical protein